MSYDNAPFLILACGALAEEILTLLDCNKLKHKIKIQCLPASLHNTPQKIPMEVDKFLAKNLNNYQKIFVAYGDCGTGGLLDRVLNKYKIERLTGAHCYQFLASTKIFKQLISDNIGSFFVTDYLLKNFNRLVWQSLGLDKYPELKDSYFANYSHLVYLSQSNDDNLTNKAKVIAKKLQLQLIVKNTGFGDLGQIFTAFNQKQLTMS